jgi:penicillin-binding protein 1C
LKWWVILLAIAFALLGGGMVFLSLPLDVTPFQTYVPSFALYDREGRLLCLSRSPQDEWLLPVPLREMGKWLPLLAVESEDQRFFKHHGVDFLALLRALWQNLSARRIVSGASTITTQLLRLVRPRPRSLPAKLLEYVEALRLERRLTKEEILESYLNRVPLGGNIRGVEAASLYYFGKRAQDLSLAEAAALVSLFPAPERFRPDRNPQGFLTRRNALLERLSKRGTITQREYVLAQSVPPPSPRGFPRFAYHAGQLVEKLTSASSLSSTISLPLQAWLERRLQEAVEALPQEVTACALVVENTSGDVLAYVGNARFGEGSGAGFVDCLQAPRSPGSALKPFVYARAFDRGLLVPSSLLADTPFGLSGNVPRNFDEAFRGPVNCRTALALSLNIPAVRVARMVSLRDTLNLFRVLGFSHLTKDENFYGDALILGGCEVTPWELAEAYTALARLGEPVQLSLLAGNPVRRGERVFSKGSAYMVSDILADTLRFTSLRVSPRMPLCAFKTGTSYGLRDAWTVAYNPRYTVLVWFGDPKGTPHEELVGIRLATPVALRVMEYLMQGKRSWYACPEDIEWYRVCAVSGKLASPFCENTTFAPFLRGVSPLKVCDMHRREAKGGVVQWPRDIAMFFGEGRFASLSIVSPLAQRRYFLLPSSSTIRLPLRAEGGEERIYWFVNGEYRGQSAPQETLFVELPPGEYALVASDERGRSDTVVVTVERPPFARTKADLGFSPQ